MILHVPLCLGVMLYLRLLKLVGTSGILSGSLGVMLYLRLLKLKNEFMVEMDSLGVMLYLRLLKHLKKHCL